MIQYAGDIAFVYMARSASTLGPADMIVGTNDLIRDPGLESACIITIGTDARADNSDILPNKNSNRSGFWGSQLLGFQVGNKLWLLGRSNLTSATAATARQYLEEGFEWMIREGIASEIIISAWVALPSQLNFSVKIYKPSGSGVTFGFYLNWENQIMGGIH